MGTGKRIWELDAVRGIAILAVLVVHAFYYLDRSSSLIITWSGFSLWVKQYAGVFFVILSGLCASLGTKSTRRGWIVLACGFILTAATSILFLCGIESESILIQWGVLHLIGFSMLVYGLFRKLPDGLLLVISLAVIVIGYYLYFNVRVESRWLFPIGLRPDPFYSMDWFPIFPHLGWFLLGSLIGKCLYKNKESLLNWKFSKSSAAKFLCFCGRNSLIIYMLHHPVFYCIANLI